MAPTGVPGIDVSNHQGTIDWARVAADGVAFAFIKATEGTFFNDIYFPRNWQQSREYGIQRGAYHFARPSRSLPENEAEFFLASLRHAGGVAPTDMVVLDMEDTNYQGGGPYGSAGAWSLGFLQYIEGVLGFPPIFYWSPWYRPNDIAAVPDLANYALWIAAYQPSMPPAPKPWSQISFWQYSDHGSVGGISPCDMNVFNGSTTNLPLMGMPGTDVVPPQDYAVGPGIWASMVERQDMPATNEHYVTPDWSEAFGISGRRYVYVASLNEVMVYEPGR